MRRQLRQLAARVESAREEERARISREVYDEFG
jgi:signal transduction histidine kinase